MIELKFNIKKKRKVVLVLFIPLSIPLMVLLFLMIRQEIWEHFVYGDKSNAKIVNIEALHNPSFPGGGPPKYKVVLIDLGSNNKLNEIFTVNDGIDRSLRNFINQVNVSDTVQIKVLNHSQAKILIYKDLEVQPYNSYINLFWYYLVILFLIALVIFPYYVLIKYKK